LIKAQYLQTSLKFQGENPLDYHYTLKKQEGKTGLFQEWVPMETGRGAIRKP
jgi:hypothetical protein